MKQIIPYIVAPLISFFMAFLVIIFPTLKTTDHHETRRVGESDALRSFEWWYNQRAYPYELIPQGAFERAARYVNASIKKERKYSPMDANSSQWSSLGPTNIGGRTLALAVNPIDPNIVWAGAASGGLWKSTTGGEGTNAWSYINTGQNTISVSTIALDPTNPDIIYIGTGEISRYQRPLVGTPGARASYGMGILKSTDGGTTWTQTGLTFTFPQITAVQKIIINPLNTSTLFAATSEGVYKSIDAGATWYQGNAVLMAMDAVMHPTDTTILYSSHGNLNSSPNPGIYMSLDAGESWDQLTNGLPSANFGRTPLAISPSNSSILYAGISSGASLGMIGLYKSTDGGLSWSAVSTLNYVGNQGWYNNVVAVHPESPDTVYCGGIDIYQSSDGGTLGNISSGRVHVDQHAIAFHPTNPRLMYFGCDGGVYKTTDGGSTFIDCNNGYITTQFYPGFANAAADSTIALGGLQDNGSLRYTGSPIWSHVLGADGGWCAIDPTNKNIMYAEHQNLVVFKSTNGGNSFFNINNGLPSGSNNTNFIPPFVISPSSPNILYAGARNVYKTTNGGSSWFSSNGAATLNGTNIACIGVSWTNPDTVLAATGTGALGASSLFEIFRSINGGQTWTNVTGSLPNRYPTDIKFHPTDSKIAYVTYSGYGTAHLFKTTDAGLTWNDFSANLPDIPHQCVTVDPEQTENMYVGTDLGVFRSSDGGISWEEFNNSMPAAMVLDLTISRANNAVRASTFGNGVYERKLIRTPSLALSSPNGGEVLAAGLIEEITWTQKFLNLVKLEYSTDDGSNWTLIADLIPASPASYAWSVSFISTTQGRIRITDAESGSLVDISDSVFTIMVNPDVFEGWNLLSIDLAVPDSRKNILFPTALSEAFTYARAYVRHDTLLNGVGYWLKFAAPQFTLYTGDSILSDTIEVQPGWNMIGSISKSIEVNSITEIPSGIVASLYYGFHSGYYTADSIRPKKGYWIKTSASGSLVLSASLSKIPARTENELDELNRLSIFDSKGCKQILYFTTETEVLDLNRYELPPPPPRGMFDVRFASGRMVEVLNEHQGELPIIISAASYPVRLSWKIKQPSNRLIVQLRDRTIDLEGSGETQISYLDSQIFLKLSPASIPEVPREFALFQNYPNPFNPSTVIRFQLPVSSWVTLKVYDMLGQEVTTLVQEFQDSGLRSVQWDADDIPSGIYFYRLVVEPIEKETRATKYVSVRKMLVLK
ncbi:MAG: T9SS type A sorting domain-containing protein [Ignavibacteriae bacterium]|nr:T9SS type A sorting domain-containing protein [Ignavibacteriota bacterium]